MDWQKFNLIGWAKPKPWRLCYGIGFANGGGETDVVLSLFVSS